MAGRTGASSPGGDPVGPLEHRPASAGRLDLQPLTRAKLGALGTEGAAWLDRLPATLAALERQWGVRFGTPLPGGSAAFVIDAERPDGMRVVVKVVIETDGLDQQVATLARADGRGYARLLDFDPDRRALLMEALGEPVERAGLPVEDQLDLLADTLARAWQPPLPDQTPLDKAGGLADLITRWWPELGRPCSAAVYETALELAERRRADPGEPVVVHGDPHPGNLLRVPEQRPGAETGYCFVDPDGFVADRAYDLGVALRDWTARLTGPDPVGTLRGYATRLAERTGVAVDRIWEWGFVERVSTGLYLASFGADGLARRFLASAERLV